MTRNIIFENGKAYVVIFVDSFIHYKTKKPTYSKDGRKIKIKIPLEKYKER